MTTARVRQRLLMIVMCLQFLACALMGAAIARPGSGWAIAALCSACAGTGLVARLHRI